MDNREFEKLYKNAFNNVHASTELLNKVENQSADCKKIKFDFRIIPVVAACLVAVILGVIIISPFSASKNSFVLKAGAAQIGEDSAVAIASVNPVRIVQGSGILGATIPFTVFCDGNNIESVKYSAENAVFVLPFEEYDIEINEYAKDWRELCPEAAELSDKVYDKVLVENKINNGLYDAPQYSSYRLNYEDQKKLEKYDDISSFPIELAADMSVEGYESKMDNYNDVDMSELEENEELFNEMQSIYLEETQVLYNDMFSDVRIIIEVTYKDGTTDCEVFKLSCIRANEEEGFVIGAQILVE